MWSNSNAFELSSADDICHTFWTGNDMQSTHLLVKIHNTPPKKLKPPSHSDVLIQQWHLEKEIETADYQGYISNAITRKRDLKIIQGRIFFHTKILHFATKFVTKIYQFSGLREIWHNVTIVQRLTAACTTIYQHYCTKEERRYPISNLLWKSFFPVEHRYWNRVVKF